MYTALGDVPLIQIPDDAVYEEAFAERPTVLFFHGNVHLVPPMDGVFMDIRRC